MAAILFRYRATFNVEDTNRIDTDSKRRRSLLGWVNSAFRDYGGEDPNGRTRVAKKAILHRDEDGTSQMDILLTEVGLAKLVKLTESFNSKSDHIIAPDSMVATVLEESLTKLGKENHATPIEVKIFDGKKFNWE